MRDALPDVVSLAAKWAAQHPELASRLGRAIELVSKVTRCDYSPDTYFVEGSGDCYTVRVFRAEHRSTCTCPDSQRGNHCKHRLAAALFEKSSPQLALF